MPQGDRLLASPRQGSWRGYRFGAFTTSAELRIWSPRSVLEAPAFLFRASEGEGNDAPFCHVYDDPLLGWARWVSQPVTVCPMPGGHSSMLQEPHVAVMAERLKTLLANARVVVVEETVEVAG